MDKKVNEIFGMTQYLYHQNMNRQLNEFHTKQKQARQTGKSFEEILREIQEKQ